MTWSPPPPAMKLCWLEDRALFLPVLLELLRWVPNIELPPPPTLANVGAPVETELIIITLIKFIRLPWNHPYHKASMRGTIWFHRGNRMKSMGGMVPCMESYEWYGIVWNHPYFKVPCMESPLSY